MVKKTDVPNLESIKEKIAYHESGHAVMAYLMGRRVLNVQIFPHGIFGYNGQVIDDSDDNPPSLEETKKSICVLYGGVVAERIKYSSSDVRPSLAGFRDRCKIAKLLEQEDIEDQEELLRDKTSRLLNENWSILEGITERLIQGKNGYSMKEDEVMSIINSSK